ncbi:hypothetical protein Golax_021337 [Gossypium laxum]|uniref:Uncharacterized protein n=1 Tax=Gossypium laxum TaxID=34288 RepID=A0A7J9AL37_9ROSI|nr:hypothetical protein [Gossypium laxum]
MRQIRRMFNVMNVRDLLTYNQNVLILRRRRSHS